MSDNLQWNKISRILEPNSNYYWMLGWAGASCAIHWKDNVFRIYVTGKDAQGRSRIGTCLLDLKTYLITELSDEPIIELGERGSFDENGTSYPCVIKYKDVFYMYYLGWLKGVHVPWYNGLFLATSKDGINFSKYSKAPIMDRDHEDYLGVGSVYVMKDNNNFKMWYSRFDSWGKNDTDHKHYYNIKLAESENLITWKRNKPICINFKDRNIDYAIAKPSVLKINDKYYMWYSYRGEVYKIGFAVSDNGQDWRRYDEFVGIDFAESGWDSNMLCYAYVFLHNDNLYMLYNGNNYGESGLGLATIGLKEFCDLTAIL